MRLSWGLRPRLYAFATLRGLEIQFSPRGAGEDLSCFVTLLSKSFQHQISHFSAHMQRAAGLGLCFLLDGQTV